jgi:hypothetical protein
MGPVGSESWSQAHHFRCTARDLGLDDKQIEIGILTHLSSGVGVEEQDVRRLGRLHEPYD